MPTVTTSDDSADAKWYSCDGWQEIWSGTETPRGIRKSGNSYNPGGGRVRGQKRKFYHQDRFFLENKRKTSSVSFHP